MPRDNPKFRNSDTSQPEAPSRSAGDQAATKTANLPKKAPPGAASLTTGDAEAQSPLGARGDRPPESTCSFETNPAHPASVDVSGPGRDVTEGDPPCSAQNRPDEKTSPVADRGEREPIKPHEPSMMSGWKGLVVVALVALICGAASAWAYTELLGPSKSHDKSLADQKQRQSGKKGGPDSGGKKASEKGDSGKDKAADSGSEIPGFTSADDAETLKKQIAHLSERMDRVNQRLDSLKQPEDKTPPELHTLQVRVTELTKDLDETAELPAQFRDLEHRLSALEQQVKSLRDDVAPGAGSQVEKPSQDRSSPHADAAKPEDLGKPEGAAASEGAAGPQVEADRASSADDGLNDGDGPSDEAQPGEADVNDDDATMDLGAELFGNGRYAQARDVFRRLQKVRPHDARVWYYSALANGIVTHAWDGETKRLFERGVERERAGTPSPDRISATFEKLQPAKAKEQLSHYRESVAKPTVGTAGSDPADRYRLTNESLEVP